MGDFIRVDTTGVRNVSEKVQQACMDALKAADEAESAGKAMDSLWEGEAKEKYQIMLAKDISTVREACGLLNEISGYESFAAASYENCEEDAAGRIQEAAV